MMVKLMLALAVLASAAAPSPRVCDVAAYGAVAGDTTAFRRNAAALARAFTSCSDPHPAGGSTGGGRVVVPAGLPIYTNPVLVAGRSNVELHLPAGASLRGQANMSAWPTPPSQHPLLHFLGNASAPCDGIAIVGEGVIDGQGEVWWRAAAAATPPYSISRPKLLIIEQCSHVHVQNVKMRQPGEFHVSLLGVKHALFEGVRINTTWADGPSKNGWSPNTDGVSAGTAPFALEASRRKESAHRSTRPRAASTSPSGTPRSSTATTV